MNVFLHSLLQDVNATYPGIQGCISEGDKDVLFFILQGINYGRLCHTT
jgi:hypothetical protein